MCWCGLETELEEDMIKPVLISILTVNCGIANNW